MPTKARGSKIGDHKSRSSVWRKFLTPQIKIAIILSGLCLVAISFCLIKPGAKNIFTTSQTENMAPMEKVTSRDTLIQKFTSDKDYDRFGLYYANYTNYTQGGTLYIDLETSDGNKNEYSYDIGTILDNSVLYISQPLKQGETYTITIRLSDDAAGVTFYTTTATDAFGAKLSRNGKVIQDSSIVMTFVTSQNNYFPIWYFIMTLMFAVCYIALNIDKDFYVQEV